MKDIFDKISKKRKKVDADILDQLKNKSENFESEIVSTNARQLLQSILETSSKYTIFVTGKEDMFANSSDEILSVLEPVSQDTEVVVTKTSSGEKVAYGPKNTAITVLLKIKSSL